MGQVTIYLEAEVEHKMVTAAKAAHLSKSKWIAQLIQDKVADEWPQFVAELAGAWDDFPTIDNLRSHLGEDVERESL